MRLSLLRAAALALAVRSALCLSGAGGPSGAGGHLAPRSASSVPPHPGRFLLVSAPRRATVSYIPLGVAGALAGAPRHPAAAEDLILKGLVAPQGLAVQQRARRLLVADPGARKIFSYPLRARGGALSVGERSVCADDVESRWVAVDHVGNILFTDESRNQILKITPARALAGNTTPEVVYDGASLALVSAPGGLAADNFHAYWVNKQVGTRAGSVVMAAQQPAERPGGAVDPAESARPLARNVDKSYGICFSRDNVFYTQPERTMYGVKKGGGGDAVPITSLLTNPRGCVWDGDGTVYVADRGANAVYSFPGNMHELSAVQITKAANFEDAFGVAMYSGASGPQAPSVRGVLLGLALMHGVLPLLAAVGWAAA